MKHSVEERQPGGDRFKTMAQKQYKPKKEANTGAISLFQVAQEPKGICLDSNRVCDLCFHSTREQVLQMYVQ